MLPGDLEAWLEEGRFQTDARRRQTGGAPNIEHRTRSRRRSRIAADTPEPGRPRYGYAQGSQEDAREINHYAGCSAVPWHIRERGDRHAGRQHGVDDTAESPSASSRAADAPDLPCRFSDVDVLGAAALADACDQYYRYAEVQIYGELLPSTSRKSCLRRREAPADLRHRSATTASTSTRSPTIRHEPPRDTSHAGADAFARPDRERARVCPRGRRVASSRGGPPRMCHAEAHAG